jgi:hypothetical protein
MSAYRPIAPRFLAGLVAGLTLLAPGGCSKDPPPTIDEARAELRGYIEDVTQATARRYAVVDDRGREMDTVKIIAVPESGGFVGLYHSYREDTGTFAVHLATSEDLMDWTWRRQLGDNASMPTIKPASDGGYVVAWEQEPPNHLRLMYYASWNDLLVGAASKTFDAPLRLSSCAEGTPNLYAASSTAVDVGFHFYRDCQFDREARGTTDWHSWTASARPTLDAALEARGVMGGIGDRDVIRFRGFDLTLIEGQLVNEDPRTWRVFLYDDQTGNAQPLHFRTPGGSIAFANPTIADIEIGGRKAILVTLFIHDKGARGSEAGELIYYRAYGSAALDE